MKNPCVYIMASERNGTLYTGVTSDLVKRVSEHKIGNRAGFTKRYECKILVYYEVCGSMENAIRREKQVKAGSRANKIHLIEEENPLWKDLFDDLF